MGVGAGAYRVADIFISCAKRIEIGTKGDDSICISVIHIYHSSLTI